MRMAHRREWCMTISSAKRHARIRWKLSSGRFREPMSLPDARPVKYRLLALRLLEFSDVRFRGQSGHRMKALECPLLTQSGHCHGVELRIDPKPPDQCEANYVNEVAIPRPSPNSRRFGSCGRFRSDARADALSDE